jgi:sec-independent protein translocase protein TatA
MFSGIGGSEILLIVLAVLILFGSKRIPEFARALGRGMEELRKALREIREEVEREAPVEHRDSDPTRPG